MYCLLCGREATDPAHFPVHTGMGRKRKKDDGLPRVPLCRQCHTEQHMGLHTETLIARAPDWWRSVGEWERAEPYYQRFLSRRAFLEAVR